ncbi:MAG TPA: DHH family phosphoesterase, partial [Candidatus Nanoarchaeia archaeon]|nr:DHH family phosphoesterase [Candidatus Nanoarchaeia archaeon]
DLWLAVAGCISDRFLPDFYEDFKKQFSELVINSDDAFEILYKSEIGKIARIFGFALKDRITNVINMQKFLMQAKSPYDALNEIGKNRTMHERYKEVNKKYIKFIEKAKDSVKDYKKLLYFQYGGDMSISADLSNQLSYDFPDKIIVVVYVSGIKANISARGKNVRNLILKSIEGIEGATGGGHEEAVGAQMKSGDLDRFKERLVNFVE